MADEKDQATAVAETEGDDAAERPEQTVTIEDVGPARKKLTIELPESRIKDKIEGTFKTLRDDAVIPGFRRGRAPRRLIERRFNESIQQDVKGQLISEAYTQAIEDEKLDVIGEPEVKDIEELKVPDSGPMTIVVEVEVSPEVTLPDYATLSIKKPKAEVTDADVDAEIERYRERLGKMSAVEGAEVAARDFIRCDVHVYAGEDVEAKPHAEGDGPEPLLRRQGVYVMVRGEGDDFRGHVAGLVVEDLGKRLIGKKVGDEVRISMTGPQGHEDEKIKGQPITIHLKIDAVERREPASVEHVTQQLGFETVEAMKEQLKPVLQQRAEQRSQSEVHRQIADQLLEKVDLELPEGLTSRQAERVLRRRAMDLAYEGLNEQQVEERIAEMRSGSEEEAKRQLKLFFIINEAAEKAEIEVTENEINYRVTMMAMQQGRRPEKFRQELQREGQLEQLYLQVREQKTLDAIASKANVEQVDAPAEDAGKAN
jgi:trigger factor